MKLQNLVPPVVTEFLKKNRRVKIYDSYGDALADCPHDAYQNKLLCDVIADKTLRHIQELGKQPFHLTPTTVYLAFALNHFATATGKKTITVLDFGGACGAHYFEARNIVPDTLSLKWIVVETQQMIKSATDRGLAKGELSFAMQTEAVRDEIDIVHSSSALQYVPAPYEFLKKLICVRAKMLVLNRMMFNKKNNDIITVQQSLLSSNGPGELPAGYGDALIKYPHTTMSYSKMNELVKGGGFDLFCEFEEPSGKLSLGKAEILGKGMIFLAKEPVAGS